MAKENSQWKGKKWIKAIFPVIHFHSKNNKLKPHFIPEKQGFALVIKKISALQIYGMCAKKGEVNK